MLTSNDLGLFLVALAGSASVATITLAWYEGIKQNWGRIAFVVSLLILAVMIASLANPGENVVVQVFVQSLKAGRTQTALMLAGFSTGVISALALAVQDRRKMIVGAILLTFVISSFALLTLKDTLSKYLEVPDATGASGFGVQRTAVGNFKVQEYATLPISPTSIAVNDQGQVFVCGYSGASFQNGSIIRLDKNPKTGVVEPKLVATHLNRPHGIAFYQGDLFVSRAGQFSRAKNGKITQENTGAVTRLRDLDNDGVYDDYHDIVADLPGALLPDGLHQNNGIAFDNTGHIYITVGAPTDHENFTHPLAGTIMIANADGSESKVFAKGLRNPYDIAIGPDGALFCTDNDSNEMNSGDELNHIVADQHYGFPYTTDKNTLVEGTTPPICRLTSAEGIVYAAKGVLPNGFDDSLYVASFADGNINRIQLTRSGETYTGKPEFFAFVPNVIDLTINNEGVMYACSHVDKKVFIISSK